MARTALPSQKHVQDEIQNNKDDISSKISVSDVGRRGHCIDERSSVSSAGDVMDSVKGNDTVDHSLTTDQYMGYPWANYYGYHYPGHYILAGNFDASKNLHGNELGSQCPMVQSEDGLFMILSPGYQSGFCPYSTCIPAPAVGIDEPYTVPQFYTQNTPSPIFSTGYYPAPIPIPDDSGLLLSHAWDPPYVGGTDLNGSDSSVTPSLLWPNNTPVPQTNDLYTYPDHLLSLDMKNTSETKASTSFADAPRDTIDPLKAETKGSLPHSAINPDAAFAKSYYPHSKPASYSHTTSTYLYPSGHVHLKYNGKGWDGNGVLKNNRTGDMIESCLSTDIVCCKSSSGDVDSSNNVDSFGKIVPYIVKRDQYNRSEFPVKYDRATFFVIKSYSEDDVHKSIKYNVWASTSDGNRKLDGAYNCAQQRSSKCCDEFPIFLFFSVNGSGQFCGVAEMTGYVDFSRKMDFWQQDKWNGFFPLKWHIIKDVPNLQLRHILLENNDNKPVTNSRDTQEVGFPQGMEMLRIFKNYTSRTSILDDFGFYESRQKVMQDRRLRSNLPLSYQFKMGDEGSRLVENISLCGDQEEAVEAQIGGDETP